MRIRKAISIGRLAMFLSIALLPMGSGARAQAVFGSIFGTVTDNTGAAVPKATVTVTDVAKGTSISVVSNDSGEFTAEHLIPDTYNVKIEVNGFKGFQQTDIRVFADSSVKVTAALEVGSQGETVNVNADTVPLLKTDRADVSTTFSSQEIVDLPIPDRNFTNLQLLLPGAQLLGWSHAADENPQGSKQIEVDGQAFAGVAFQLDGTDNQDPILGIIVVNPNADSLSESKITTQNFDAEFGKAVSSVVTAQTKSGTNAFHGSAFDYRQSNANLARDPFTQPPTSAFPPGLKNQFGGSIGGPILKDKFFFFGDYQGVRQKVGISAVETVPTPLLVSSCLAGACNFSEYATAQGTAQGVTNPGAYQLIYNNSNGTPVPYANNIVNTGLSPQALALLKLLQPYAPNTNSGGTFGALRENYAESGTGGFNSDQWDTRLDFTVNQNIHAFARFSRFTDTLTGTTIFGPAGGAGFGLGGYGGSSVGANDSTAAGVDIALSPKLVTDVRAGYFRYNIVTGKYDQGTAFATQLGIPGLNAGDPFTSGAPGFILDDPGFFGATGQNGDDPTAGGPQYGSGLNINRCNCELEEREDQFQLANNWTRTIGNHSVKFGADLRYARNLRVPSDNNRTGLLNFGTGPTGNGNSGTGLGFATFLL
ncbi:MAG TPA: carboxypeptidase-like regulatory domain-containing protein, partial [Acidobacteriaceae bacterium]|nr:carboxypeptidase-like regulatory domain-containing protein [Acidobacteriaceae bacterium]